MTFRSMWERLTARPRFPRSSASEPRFATLALAALIAVYALLGGLDAILAPAFEKPDEQWHFAYVAYLLEHGQLPPLVANETLNPALQEAGQPPLFYGLAAASARLLGLEAQSALVPSNPYWGYPARGTVDDNKNRFVHASAEYAQPALRIIYVLRGLSLLLGAGAIVAAYGLARALNASRGLAWCAAAVLTLQPQFLYIAGSVSNDASVTFLCGAALWALIAATRDQRQTRRWLLAGLWVGLAALAKTSALWLAVFGTGLALWQAWRLRSTRVALVGLASVWGGVLLCSGWWYARNWVQFGDPLGLSIHRALLGSTTVWTLPAMVEKWLPLGKSFWATFGWGNVELPAWVYSGFGLVELLAALGLALLFLKKRRGAEWRAGYGLMLLYVGGVVASLVAWMFSTGWVLGRLLFPALVPLVVLAAAGWKRLWAPLPWLVLAYLGLVAYMAPEAIGAAFSQPARLPHVSAPEGTQPAALSFGQLARLIAYDISPRWVAPGGETTVTLCWEALDATPRDYSVFVHLLGPVDALVGRRDTYPGLGAFATSLWKQGDAFCDRVIVPVNKDAPGEQVYGVEVGLFDRETMERLPASDAAGQALPQVIVGRVKVSGAGGVFPPSAAPVQANFSDQISLLGYEAGQPAPGKNLSVTLYWQAQSGIPVDYTVFMHMLDTSGSIVAQADAPPKAGWLPTSWWEPGKLVVDEHWLAVPAALPSGDYRLQVGLYLPDTGERLALTGSGQDAADLGLIRVP
jgi:hypothetical protein